MAFTTLRLIATLAAIASAAPVAQAASVRDVFEKYGLLGAFAWHCDRPPNGENNWYFVNVPLDGGRVQRDYMSGPSTRQWTAIFDKAAEPRPNEIVVSGRIAGQTVNNEPVDGLWRIDRNRIQQWSSTLQGKPLIVEGRLNGRDLPWLIKCGPAPALEAHTEILKVSTKALTDQQFLTGATNGPVVTISGELRIPKSADARLPAIVLLHGSGGIKRNVHDWIKVLDALALPPSRRAASPAAASKTSPATRRRSGAWSRCSMPTVRSTCWQRIRASTPDGSP